MNRMEIPAVAFVVVASLSGVTDPSAAIDAHPTEAQIRAALELGVEAAGQHRPPDSFYVRFGGTEAVEAGGFLITKLGSLSVLASHMALRGLEPTPSDISQISEASTMLVSINVFGDVPSFAVDSYMVLDQEGQTIKPAMVRFDAQADRSPIWPRAPRYKAKVVASFNYADFNPMVRTSITVFLGHGQAVSFSLDFAQIK